MMQYDLQKALKSMDPKKINSVVIKYNKHFGNSIPGNALNKESNNKNNEDDSDDSEGDRVKEELLRQRNWIESKLQNMNKSNKKLENERKKIQNDNLELIRVSLTLFMDQKCNKLRDDNHKRSKRVQLLEKKFKDLIGNREYE